MTLRDVIFTILLGIILLWPTEIPKKLDVGESAQVYATIAVKSGTWELEKPETLFGKAKKRAVFESENVRVSRTFPTPAILGATAISIASVVENTDAWLLEDYVRFLRTWLMIPLALLGFVMLRRVLAALSCSEDSVDIASLTWLAGTAFLQLGGAAMYHQVQATMTLLALNFIVVSDYQASEGRSPMVAMAFGGLFTGALAASHAMGPIFAAGVMAVASLNATKADRKAQIVYFAVSLVGFALWYAYYSIAFDGFPPLDLAVAERLVTASFSTSAGLFFVAPLLLSGVAATLVFARQRRGPWSAFIAFSLAGTVLTVLAEIDATNLGYAQSVVLPMVTALAVGLGVWGESVRGKWSFDAAFVGITTSAMLSHTLMRLFIPNTPVGDTNPMAELVPLMISEGVVPENRATEILGDGLLSIVPPLIAALIVVGLFAWPQIRHYAGRRAKFGAVAGLVCLVHLGLISNLGGHWTEDERKAAETAFDKINSHNDSFKRRALDAVHKVDGMDK